MTPRIWDEVATALREKRVLEIDYKKPGKEVERRLVEPYSLALGGTAWILVARDPDDGNLKSFYLARVRDARLTEGRYAIPKGFSPDQYFGESIGVFVSRKPFTFRVRISRKLADWVSEVRWHPRQRCSPEADGAVVLELPSESLWEARRFVLTFGRFARALSPPELVEDLRQEVAAMAAAYTADAGA